MLHRALIAGFAALLASLPAPQDPPRPACESCKDRGVLACRLCANKACNSERGFQFCSLALECSDCGGVRLRECSYCEHSPEVDVAARKAELAKWRATLAPLDQFMSKNDIAHVESEHFVLDFEPKKSGAKVGATQHAAVHLYADRLEQLFADFRAEVGGEPSDFSNKTQVMVWSREADQAKAASKYTLERSSTQAKLMGLKPVVSVLFGKGRVRSDEQLHHALVHQVAHCLLSNLYDGVWLGSLKNGWLDEGVAHYFETKYFGSVAEWCYFDDETIDDLELGRFEAEVLARLRDDKALDLLAVAGQDTVALSVEQRLFGWSYTDWLARAKPGTIAAIARLLKKQKPMSEALKSALGLAAIDVQQTWRTWALATYSAKVKR